MPKFCHLATTPVYKKSRFPVNMLIFMQKGITFSGLIVKIFSLDLHYSTSGTFANSRATILRVDQEMFVVRYGLGFNNDHGQVESNHRFR